MFIVSSGVFNRKPGKQLRKDALFNRSQSCFLKIVCKIVAACSKLPSIVCPLVFVWAEGGTRRDFSFVCFPEWQFMAFFSRKSQKFVGGDHIKHGVCAACRILSSGMRKHKFVHKGMSDELTWIWPLHPPPARRWVVVIPWAWDGKRIGIFIAFEGRKLIDSTVCSFFVRWCLHFWTVRGFRAEEWVCHSVEQKKN